MMKKNLILPATGLALGAILALGGCSSDRDAVWQENTGVAWGTTYTIKYLGPRNLDDSVIAIMRQVELAVSIFDKESNVSRLNAGLTDSVYPLTAAVFAESKRVNAVSNGYFDPTVAPLIDLWGFGPNKDSATDTVPSDTSIRTILEYVGIDECSLNANGTLHRKDPRTTFNFSAIAKGFGVDCIAAMLHRNDIEDYMVEIGGEIAVSGHNASDRLWNIQIDSPESGKTGHEALEKIELTDCAIATSGNYRNNRELSDGTSVWHTISPLTGQPVEPQILSATVIAPKCMTADALATAAMAMPLDQAIAMLRDEPRVSALLLTTDNTTIRIGCFHQTE